MKLAYKDSECGGAITLLAFLLFVASLILDFCSTAFVLSTETKFVELNPIVRADDSNPLPELLRVDLIAGCVALITVIILIHFRDLFRASRILKEISILVTKAAIMTAYAKLWFSFENMLLYFFNSNFAYELQLFLEAKGIVNIASQKSAHGFGVLIAMLVSLPLYCVTMMTLKKNEYHDA